MNSEGRVSWIPLVVSIAMLLASAGDWPYGFYQLLRMVVTGTAVYVLVRTLKHRRYWPWIMGGIAILFNPILPIRLNRADWQPIDFAVAVVFLIALIQTLRHRLRFKLAIKTPEYEQVTTAAALILTVVSGSYLYFTHTEPERYVDYCGDSVEKRPGAVQQEGITPLLLREKDVHKYQQQVQWIRPATTDELQILLRRYEQRALPSGYQLWTVTADAPSIAHTLARQYECVIEGMLDTSH